MKLKLHHSLTGRLLFRIGLATILPLTLLMPVVLFEVYQTTTAQTNATLEQTSRRYAAEVQARLAERYGLLKALASEAAILDDATLESHLLRVDPETKEAWVRRENQGPVNETALQQQLYRDVRNRGTEVLSTPDYSRREAYLGYPMVENGQFRGMVAVSFSLDYFQHLIEGIQLYDTGYAFLVAHDGTRIAHPDRSLIGVRIGNDVAPSQAEQMLKQVTEGLAFSFEKRALVTGLWSRLYYSPVTVGRAWYPWYLVAVVPLTEANRTVDVLLQLLVAGILLTLVLVTWTTWRAARSVILPVSRLAQGAEAVAEGHLDVRVEAEGGDELSTLARAFNRMTDRLVKTLQDQETLVRQRTASLRESLEDLEQAQTKIVDTEKMAVLGQLTATIAHEINTPLGAIRSSATYLHQTTSTRFGDLPEFFRTLDPPTLAWYKKLVLEKGVNLVPTTGGEDRRRRRVIAQKLKEAGLEDPEGLADDIVFLVDQDSDDALIQAALDGKTAVLRRAAETAAQVQSSSIILEAADRAAATVSALVDYSRSHDIRTDQTLDPAREFETLLTLYYGISKRGVEVVREFEPGLTVRGDRDKLNQVWVNLINNALQAMDYRGRLLIRTRTLGHGVEIAVANDGPRVPDELKEKIFQPFFTTKKAGEGTGLGLDICRRIVEAHHGSLVLGEEGHLTVFTVRLPAPERSPE